MCSWNPFFFLFWNNKLCVVVKTIFRNQFFAGKQESRFVVFLIRSHLFLNIALIKNSGGKHAIAQNRMCARKFEPINSEWWSVLFKLDCFVVQCSSFCFCVAVKVTGCFSIWFFCSNLCVSQLEKETRFCCGETTFSRCQFMHNFLLAEKDC